MLNIKTNIGKSKINIRLTEHLILKQIQDTIAVETLGALGEEVAQFISDLGRRIAATTSEPRSVTFLFQRLSVAIQRGNAVSLTGISASSAKLCDIFYLV